MAQRVTQTQVSACVYSFFSSFLPYLQLDEIKNQLKSYGRVQDQLLNTVSVVICACM
jgi:hypothetical protein